MDMKTAALPGKGMLNSIYGQKAKNTSTNITDPDREDSTSFKR
ncbi:MAG: hypothetical protein R6V23_06120 [Bacteroidales bacterium]